LCFLLRGIYRVHRKWPAVICRSDSVKCLRVRLY
jgi:hypothetical protein